MTKRPESTSGKRQPTGPMTLGNMRSLGPRDLDVTSKACGYWTTVNVDAFPDDVGVPSFGPRMRCSKCGHLRARRCPNRSCQLLARLLQIVCFPNNRKHVIRIDMYF
jgi:hypothetical protein